MAFWKLWPVPAILAGNCRFKRTGSDPFAYPRGEGSRERSVIIVNDTLTEPD